MMQLERDFGAVGRVASLRRLGLAQWAGWRPLLAFALPFALYLLTLAPTVYNLDSAELTTAAATGGIVRATGYPLYLLIGRAWSALPIGDVGFRMNGLSAVCGALTVLMAERILRRWRVGGWATLGALGLLATAFYFWGLSLIAEVYTLHTLLMGGLILALLRWRDAPSGRRLAVVGLLVGVGLSHHLATVLLLPGCAWYALTVAPRAALAPRALLAGALGLAAGLSLYLYLPFLLSAAPAFNYAGTYDATGAFHPVNLRSIEGLVWLVSGRAFADQMGAYSAAELLTEAARYVAHMARAFFVWGIGPGLLGALLLLRRDWRVGGMMALMFAVNAAFYVNYRVVDKETMFLPTYLVWALWSGVGLQTLLDWLRESGDPLVQRWGTVGTRAWIGGGLVVALVATWPLVDLSGDTSTRRLGERILRQVEPHALVIGFWDTVPVVEYLQHVEGQRPDVQAVNRFLISSENLQRLILREVERRPVYLDDDFMELSGLRAQRVGPLYRLVRAYPPPPATLENELHGR